VPFENDGDDDEDDPGPLAAALAVDGSFVRIDEIAKACNSFARDARRFHPVKLAATFGGLLTQGSPLKRSWHAPPSSLWRQRQLR
jgi:hypothetical protein